jgi:serine protease Do
MKRAFMSLVLLAAAAVSASAQDDPVKALQKKVQETARKVSAAFVFFSGGSGVLISEDGWLLTNHHVIAAPAIRGVERPPEGAVKVMLQDGKQRLAELKCTDAVGDIALFKLNGGADEKYPFVTFGDSDKLEIGQYVLAIGAPFGIGALGDPAPDGRHYPSVSLGIVSALHRYQEQYGDCIQTDAAVNPGNSGGPLVDLDGRLVGINGRILTRYLNRVNSGVGFAVASNQIQNFLPKMKEGGINRRIYHGRITGLDLAEHAEDRGGILVREVAGDSAAAKRGLRPGDVVLSANGHKVFNVHRLRGIVSAWPAESEVSLTVRRQDKTLDIKVPIQGTAERAITGELLRPPPRARAPQGSTGATFEDEKPGEDGQVTVTFVTPFSPAETAGLSAGDVVLKVDGRDVKNRKTVLEHVQNRKPGETVVLRVMREGEEVEVKITLGQLGSEE